MDETKHWHDVDTWNEHYTVYQRVGVAMMPIRTVYTHPWWKRALWELWHIGIKGDRRHG